MASFTQPADYERCRMPLQLMLASKNGHKSIVQILIDASAELDKEYAYDEKGKHTTALG